MADGGSRMDAPGLQAERTALAWERTAIAALGTGALLLFHYRVAGWPQLLAAGFGVVLAVVLAVVGRQRIGGRRIGRLRIGR